MINQQNITFIKYEDDKLIEAAKIILSEKLYENEEFCLYNLSNEIIEENITSDYEIIFAVNDKKEFYGVLIIDKIYYKSFDWYVGTNHLTKDMQTTINKKMKVMIYIKNKYRHNKIGTLLTETLDKNNVFAYKGINGSEKFWKNNGIKCFGFDEYGFTKRL